MLVFLLPTSTQKKVSVGFSYPVPGIISRISFVEPQAPLGPMGVGLRSFEQVLAWGSSLVFAGLKLGYKPSGNQEEQTREHPSHTQKSKLSPLSALPVGWG